MPNGLRCFGIDLAWSDRNPSGGAVLDGGGRLLDQRMLGGDDEVIAWVDGHLRGPAVIGVDAPMLVPNETGRRECEAEIARIYGSRKAGAHPANRRLLLQNHRRIRGEDLASRLARRGFGDPWARADRVLLEVYPHPGLIETFGLGERLRYKKGPVAERRDGLRTLNGLLASLSRADPPLVAAPVVITDDLRGRGLKDLEDLLDARFCAWTALVWARHGTGGIRFFGGPGRGHIAVPAPPPQAVRKARNAAKASDMLSTATDSSWRCA